MSIEPGLYRHFKGGLYEVLGNAKDSSDLKEVVVYKSVKTGEWWTRPLKEFTEHVEKVGYHGPRFWREE